MTSLEEGEVVAIGKEALTLLGKLDDSLPGLYSSHLYMALLPKRQIASSKFLSRKSGNSSLAV